MEIKEFYKEEFMTKLRNLEIDTNDIFRLTRNKKFIYELMKLSAQESRLIINTLEMYTDVSSINELQKTKLENNILYIKPITKDEQKILDIIETYENQDDLEMLLKDSKYKNNIIRDTKYYNKYELLTNYKTTFKNNKKKILMENIIDFFFEDVSYNVLMNIKEILGYYEQTIRKNFLEETNYLFYKEILNLRKKTIVELVDFFKSNKQKYNKDCYYQDIRNAKNNSYEEIKDSLLKKENITTKNINGIEIFELNGEEFKSLVHVTNITKEKPLEAWENKKSNCTSVSLIDKNKLNCYKSPKEYYTFGFETFETNAVIHAHSEDSFSKYKKNTALGVSKKINQIHTPESINKGCIYNEIVIAVYNPSRTDEVNSKLKPLVPSYLVCYDDITENDIQTAKNMGLYIVKYNTQQYRILRTKLNDEDYLLNNYVTSLKEVCR